VSGYELFDRPS